MSHPALGCFAECLPCELSDEPLPGGGPGDGNAMDLLDLADIYDQDDGAPDWADPDWGPEPLDDVGSPDDLLTSMLLGDQGELRPAWDPYGVEFTWEL